MSNTPWKHNTYEAITLAIIDIETLQDQLELAQEALAEAHRVHDASEDVEGLPYDDALEQLNDEVGDYAFAEAILLNDRGEQAA